MDFEKKVPHEKIQLVTIGETVIDLVSQEFVDSLQDALEFKKHLGGSPTNIAINLRSLGFRSGIVTRLGEDGFGKYAYSLLRQRDIVTKGVQWDNTHRTSVIMVGRNQKTPDAIHYREADKYIEFTDEARQMIDEARIVHFSGFALSGEVSRNSLFAIKNYVLQKKLQQREMIARGELVNEVIMTFDPCFDARLWENSEYGRQVIKEFMDDFDIIKPSEDDLERLFGKVDLLTGIKEYLDCGPTHVILTRGGEGVIYSDGQGIERLPVQQVDVQDVTGAGDSLWAGMLAWILYQDAKEATSLTRREGELTKTLMLEAIRKGMQTATFTVQHHGAIAPLELIRDYFFYIHDSTAKTLS